MKRALVAYLAEDLDAAEAAKPPGRRGARGRRGGPEPAEAGSPARSEGGSGALLRR